MGRSGGHEHRASHGRNNSLPFMLSNGAHSDVVLVLGGCGFLGRHIINLLLEKSEGITEIRVLDIQDRPKSFSFNENPNIQLKFVKGDITNLRDIERSFQGVNAVIHCASLIDTSHRQDVEKLKRINVQGTANIIKACVAHNIDRLIYTSSSELGRTFDPIVNANEDDVDEKIKHKHNKIILNGYSTSKEEAEKMVLLANGHRLQNGNKLATVSLRPCGLYGEGDSMYVTTVIRTGRKLFYGYLPALGSADAKIQRVYVGNVAWAHVVALAAMTRKDPGVCGKAYLITDDTPICDNFTFMKPFLEARQIELLPVRIPFVVVYYFWALMELLIWLLSPLVKIPLLVNKEEVALCCTTAFYNGSQAREVLGYRPIFTPGEAMERSLTYYSTMPL